MHPKHCHSFNQNPCFQSFNSPYFLSFLCLTLMPQSWYQWRSDALLFKSEFQVEMWRSLALPRFGSFITVTCHSTGNLRPTSHASVTRSGFLPKVWLYCIMCMGIPQILWQERWLLALLRWPTMSFLFYFWLVWYFLLTDQNPTTAVSSEIYSGWSWKNSIPPSSILNIENINVIAIWVAPKHTLKLLISTSDLVFHCNRFLRMNLKELSVMKMPTGKWSARDTTRALGFPNKIRVISIIKGKLQIKKWHTYEP